MPISVSTLVICGVGYWVRLVIGLDLLVIGLGL